ncbi:MAG: CvpA family protein [Oscillospiraceae bacterium]|jgi:uncharacterized membrane protein required for colicin V production|nr:CvpA family protein [Oscillospiraceae bacterium]
MLSIFLLDGTIIILFALFIFLGFKNGVAKSLISFIGAMFSLIFSVYISSLASEFIYDAFIEKNLTNRISQIISDKNFKSEEVFNKLPNFVSNSLKIYNVTNEKVSLIMKNKETNRLKALSDLFSPAVKGVIRNVLSILIFWLLMIIIGAICKNLSYVFQFPILRQIDGLLGGIFGAFKGYVVIVILMMFLKMFLPIVSVAPKALSNKNIDSTILFSHMYKSNLIYELYKSINIFIGVGT